MNISFSEFISCESRRSGAAFACDKSTATMVEVKFINNTAQLGGGGAFVQDSVSSFKGIHGIRNIAMTKGGGMMLWTGIEPNFLCEDGTWSDSYFPGKCIACDAGKFSSVACMISSNCCECQPGQYTAVAGMIP